MRRRMTKNVGKVEPTLPVMGTLTVVLPPVTAMMAGCSLIRPQVPHGMQIVGKGCAAGEIAEVLWLRSERLGEMTEQGAQLRERVIGQVLGRRA